MTPCETRLKHLAAVPIRNGVGEAADIDDPSLPRYIRTTDIAGPRTLRNDTFKSLPRSFLSSADVRRGDLLMSAAGSVGKTLLYESDEPAVYAGYLVRFRPRPDVDPRFISYWTETPLFLGQVESGAVRSTIDNFSAGKYQNLRVSVPELDQQRRIADFLDVETARIDALITAKQQMISLLDERRWLALASEIARGDYPTVPLRRALLSITDGPFGSAFSSSDYSHEGVAVVRLGNIGFAEWRGSELAHLPSDRFGDFHRHRVSEGDLLIAGLGDTRNHAGRACVAPDLGPAIVKGKCFCARVDQKRAVPDYLAMFCSSPAGADAISIEARGSTRSMINLDIVKAIEIPLPDLARQVEIVGKVRAAWVVHGRSRIALLAQIDLLRERRQALITAAVTGELAI